MNEGAPRAQMVTTRAELLELVRALRGAPLLAIDVESDGMFAYRPAVCTVQLAAGGVAYIVDALATEVEPLAPLLGPDGPPKGIHDVAFDARLLAERGVLLGNVHDTAIAARMLGRSATGLASLAKGELGITIDKSLQHHDWRKRPLGAPEIEYLARDVEHIEALVTALWRQLGERGIEEEVLEETRYRIASAAEAVEERAAGRSEPAYVGAKGVERLPPVERAILRRLWIARDAQAQRDDVPAARLVNTDALVALARARPTDAAALAKARLPREKAAALAPAFLAAVAAGLADGDVPEADRAYFDRPPSSRDAIARRRARETTLMAWRRGEAAARGVDEQVILPGHCVKDLADLATNEVGTVQAVPGFGACRARYVEAVAQVLAGVAEQATEKAPEGAGAGEGG